MIIMVLTICPSMVLIINLYFDPQDPKEWPIIEALPSYGRGRERGYEEDILALYMEMALAMLSLQVTSKLFPFLQFI